MNPLQFLLAMRARFGVFALALAATVVAATLLSLLLPKTYKATASLVVDMKNEQSLSNALDAFIPARERIIGYLQTQVDIITSEKVARKVVRDLKLAESAPARAEFEDDEDGEGSIEDWLVANLLEWLKVKTSQSSVIQVSYLDGDPHFAALVANGFAKAYIDTMLELRVEPTRAAAVWFETQLQSLRANLEEAQARLTEYQRREGIVAADEQSDVDYTRLAELSSQLVMAQDRTIDLQSQEQQARADLAQGVPLELLPVVQSNEHIQKLREDLLSGEATLHEMATQYGVNHPSYRRQAAENRSRRQKLDAEMRKVVEGFGAAIRQSKQRETQLEAAITAHRARLLERKGSRNEAAVLMRNVETAQNAYDTALQRSVISEVEGRASQANVSVLSPAVLPRKPYRPNIALNIVLSLVVGTMLGIGIVIMMELSDRRVRALVDLNNNGANVPLLGVLNTWNPRERPLLSGPSVARRVLPGRS